MKNSFLRINYKKIVSGKGLVFVLYWFLVSKYHHPSYSCQGCAGPYHMGSTRYIMATVVTAYYYSSFLPFKEWVRPLMLFPILEFVSSFLTIFNYFPNQCPCSYPLTKHCRQFLAMSFLDVVSSTKDAYKPIITPPHSPLSFKCATKFLT